MNHPLTDEMLEQEQFRSYLLSKDVEELWHTRDDMRAAYDLGFKAGSQASEGAMQAILDTIQQNSKAMEMLADS